MRGPQQSIVFDCKTTKAFEKATDADGAVGQDTPKTSLRDVEHEPSEVSSVPAAGIHETDICWLDLAETSAGTESVGVLSRFDTLISRVSRRRDSCLASILLSAESRDVATVSWSTGTILLW